jgi:hypothetical protein
MRRTFTLAVLTIGLIMAMAGTSFAHYCYVSARSSTAANAASKSGQWVSVEVFMREYMGLCDAGVAHVQEGLAAAELPVNPAIFIGKPGVLPSASYKSAPANRPAGKGPNQDNGKGIDHLSDDYFEVLEGPWDPDNPDAPPGGLVGEAFTICSV